MIEFLDSYVEPLWGIIDIRLTEINEWLTSLCAREANTIQYSEMSTTVQMNFCQEA